MGHTNVQGCAANCIISNRDTESKRRWWGRADECPGRKRKEKEGEEIVFVYFLFIVDASGSLRMMTLLSGIIKY
jgi:hypothetical protein